MKIKTQLGALFLAAFTLLISCKHESNNPTPKVIEKTVTEDKWTITYFYDHDTDETSKFSGYDFTFNDDGTVIANKAGTATNGTWAAQKHSDHTEFTMNFGAHTILDELNDDWHVIEQSDNLLKLEDISGGNGDVEYVTFQKM